MLTTAALMDSYFCKGLIFIWVVIVKSKNVVAGLLTIIMLYYSPFTLRITPAFLYYNQILLQQRIHLGRHDDLSCSFLLAWLACLSPQQTRSS